MTSLGPKLGIFNPINHLEVIGDILTLILDRTSTIKVTNNPKEISLSGTSSR